MEAYLIKVKPTDFITFFLDIVVYGEKWDLYKKMRTMDYAKKLGIDESLFFEPFELVREDSVCFPEHTI